MIVSHCRVRGLCQDGRSWREALVRFPRASSAIRSALVRVLAGGRIAHACVAWDCLPKLLIFGLKTDMRALRPPRKTASALGVPSFILSGVPPIPPVLLTFSPRANLVKGS
jgi:hypothetical protein